MADDERARAKLYQRLLADGTLRKLILDRYVCRSERRLARDGCLLATVFRYDGQVLVAVRDVKLSEDANVATSTPEARRSNTLDGGRHWPAVVYDLRTLAGDPPHPEARIDMFCRHQLGRPRVVDILAAIAGVEPGKPGKPKVL